MIDFKNMPRVATGVIKAKLFGFHTPLKITNYVTYRCNLACQFCGRRNLVASEMTTAEIKKCMDEFKKMGTIFWGFNGGEPLLRQDIGELIDYAKKLKFKCSMVTNGTLIPKRIEQIKNLDMVIVSLDGPEPIHDAIRGPGNFEKTIKGIEILIEKKILVYVSSVINKTNLDCLDDIFKISEKYGTYLEFQPVIVHGGDVEGRAVNYFPEKEKFRAAIDWLIVQKKKGRNLTNSLSYLEQLKHYPDSPISLDCWASYLMCSITPDGFILPCSPMLEEYKNFQSGLKVGFKKAFYSLPNFKKCRSCYFSCYSEYNCALNSLPKTGLKFLKNSLFGRGQKWFWQ